MEPKSESFTSTTTLNRRSLGADKNKERFTYSASNRSNSPRTSGRPSIQLDRSHQSSREKMSMSGVKNGHNKAAERLSCSLPYLVALGTTARARCSDLVIFSGRRKCWTLVNPAWEVSQPGARSRNRFLIFLFIQGWAVDWGIKLIFSQPITLVKTLGLLIFPILSLKNMKHWLKPEAPLA